jgi:hypothetical protein
MGEIDEMRAIIEASIIADSRDGAKVRALDALYGLHARADVAEQRVERMLSEVRKVVERANRDADNARKHRLGWSEAAGCEAQMARSLLARLERAAVAEAQPAEVADV